MAKKADRSKMVLFEIQNGGSLIRRSSKGFWGGICSQLNMWAWANAIFVRKTLRRVSAAEATLYHIALEIFGV